MIEDLAMHLADLVENSLRAGANEIRVSLRRCGGDLVLEVADDGQGMGPAEAPQACDPFFTTKPGAKVGLGLPLLLQTAEEVGGECRVDSEPGRGTRVWARLPCDHPDRPPLGDLVATLIPLVATSPGVEFEVELGDDRETWRLSTREIREHIGDVPLAHPEVLSFLEDSLREGMNRTGLKESA